MNNRPVLLSRSELDYIGGNKKFSRSFEYKIKSQLKKKILLFLENEFPLLIQSGLIDINNLLIYINNNNNMLPNLVRKRSRDRKCGITQVFPPKALNFARKRMI